MLTQINIDALLNNGESFQTNYVEDSNQPNKHFLGIYNMDSSHVLQGAIHLDKNQFLEFMNDLPPLCEFENRPTLYSVIDRSEDGRYSIYTLLLIVIPIASDEYFPADNLEKDSDCLFNHLLPISMFK